MAKVISFSSRKAGLTPEQKLKEYCIRGLMGDQADEVLSRMDVDEAFAFLANEAVERGLL